MLREGYFKVGALGGLVLLFGAMGEARADITAQFSVTDCRTGQPIETAEVRALDAAVDAGSATQATTTREGIAELSPLRWEGRHRFEILATGYRTKTTDAVHLAAGSNAHEHICLEPEAAAQTAQPAGKLNELHALPDNPAADAARRSRELIDSPPEHPVTIVEQSPTGETGERIFRLAQIARERNEGGPRATFVAKQVVAVVPGRSQPMLTVTARSLEERFRLRLVEVSLLSSISAGSLLFEIPDTRSVSEVRMALQAESEVMLAQPNYLYDTTGLDRGSDFGRFHYGPHLIRADKVRALSTGQGIKVALLDTGVDVDHAELKGKVIERIDFTGDQTIFREDIHGTVIAGIIGAELNNGIGIDGIAPRVRFLSVKACVPPSPRIVKATCWSSTLAKGLDFAILKDARIINLSVGGPRDPLITLLVDKAVELNSVVVAAGGNEGPNGSARYPAALTNVIAVTAIDYWSNLYPHATTGIHIDLAAPGVDIVSTVPGNEFDFHSGTSMAAAHVTGVAALLLERKPGLSPNELKILLEATALDLGPGGKDPQFGSGRVDACKAMERLLARTELCE